jgi:hypothetical protein
MYLAQVEKPGSIERATAAAAYLGLEFEYRLTGYGGLGARLSALATSAPEMPSWQA